MFGIEGYSTETLVELLVEVTLFISWVFVQVVFESRSRKSAQDDRWSFC